MTTMSELKKRAQRAVSRAKTRERQLYRFGQPLFDWPKHQEMLKAIRDERNATLGAVRTEALEAIRELKRQLEAAHDFPRDSVLDSSACSDVTARLPLIRSELSRMSGQQLAARLRFVAEHGELAERYTHWLLAVERRNEILEKRQAGRGSGYQGPTTMLTGFDSELEALDRGLFADEFNSRTADVQDALAAAESLSEYCYTRARDSESVADAYRRDNNVISGLVERQKHARGGRPPGPSAAPWNQRVIADGSASQRRQEDQQVANG